MNPTHMELIATILFAVAILHTFAVKQFEHLSLRLPSGSVRGNLFHLLGEVEIAFGFWAGVFIAAMAITAGKAEAVHYLEALDFTEPAFVLVMMTMASTRPVIYFADLLIRLVARIIPAPATVSFYIAALSVGPLLGSFITEPAAMTVTALVLKQAFFDHDFSPSCKYMTLGILFVNVSIGGVLTHFAAPPVLMVAETWGWGISDMLTQFGWKAALAVGINTLIGAAVFFRQLTEVDTGAGAGKDASSAFPAWVITVHLLFLALVVLTAHYAVVFLGLFLFFLGLVSITERYQDDLKLRESLLVAFFLGGLVVLGNLQDWWLSPLIGGLDALPLFLGAAFLTGFTDNAALTYLGSQLPNVGPGFKYALVAGAVAGGGLTVIANAPNPAGFAILRNSFGLEGISPVGLFLAALVPTFIAMACFWWLPSL
jgi:hypothetical protein